VNLLFNTYINYLWKTEGHMPPRVSSLRSEFDVGMVDRHEML